METIYWDKKLMKIGGAGVAMGLTKEAKQPHIIASQRSGVR